MSERKWELITQVESMIEAEIIRGMLEAQDFEVLVSQEGYQHAIGLMGAPFAMIDIFVPNDQAEAAHHLMDDYNEGRLTNEEGADF